MSTQLAQTEFCISIDSRTEHLPRLRAVVGCLATNMGMTAEETQETKLAITEACANAIRHGSPEGEAGSVLIRLVANPAGIIAEVSDSGQGFNVDELAVPTEPGQKPGGLGIPLMRALADRVEFLHGTKGMTVRLFKRIRRGVRNRRLGSR
jgi:serine/threonine-protein kinase RsbW